MGIRSLGSLGIGDCLPQRYSPLEIMGYRWPRTAIKLFKFIAAGRPSMSSAGEANRSNLSRNFSGWKYRIGVVVGRCDKL